MSAQEAAEFCEYSVEAVGGAGERLCAGDQKMVVEDVGDCASRLVNIPRPCTVGALEACVESLDGDYCRIATTDECLSYRSCFPAR